MTRIGLAHRVQTLALGTLAALLLAFLVIPMGCLMLGTSWGEFSAGLRHPLASPALKLSLWTSALALVIVVTLGTPLAWLLALRRGRVSQLVETLVVLPVAIPPAVAGLALLLAFGKKGPFSNWFSPEGGSLALTTSAVVLAEVFVSSAFFLQAALAAFRRIDARLLIVARSLGASPFQLFFRIALPLAGPGLVGGAILCFARALGEFGATLMFAGNLQGKTQTLPLAIYTAMESDLRAAQALSILLLAVALALFFGVRFAERRSHASVEGRL